MAAETRTVSTTPTLEEAKHYIYSIDFSNILNKMVNHQGWLRKDAEKVCEMYRNFLYLQKKYKGQNQLPPSEEMDEFWHQHILDTKQYRKDCQAIFGEYLDHYPYFGIDATSTFSDLESAFEKMQELYMEEFGERIYQVRTIFSSLAHRIKKWTTITPSRIGLPTN